MAAVYRPRRTPREKADHDLDEMIAKWGVRLFARMAFEAIDREHYRALDTSADYTSHDWERGEVHDARELVSREGALFVRAVAVRAQNTITRSIREHREPGEAMSAYVARLEDRPGDGGYSDARLKMLEAHYGFAPAAEVTS